MMTSGRRARKGLTPRLWRLAPGPLVQDEAEAARRRTVYGRNVLPPSRRRSIAAELMAQLRDSANLELAIGILGVVILNALIGFVQEHAAERTAEALQAMVPRTARVLRAGRLTEVPATDIVPGDFCPWRRTLYCLTLIA